MHQTQHSEDKLFFSEGRQTSGSTIPKYQESQNECTLAFRCVLKVLNVSTRQKYNHFNQALRTVFVTSDKNSTPTSLSQKEKF